MWNLKRYFFLCLILSTYLVLFFYPNTSKSQDFWERINVPDSVTVLCIAVDSNSSIYIGAGKHPQGIGGVYKSNNNGETWIFTGIDYRTIYSLTISDNGTIYAGAGGGPIFKSNNGGDDWELLETNFFNNILHITIISNDTIFAGGWGGITRSFDCGQTWNKCFFISGVEAVFGIDIDSQDNIVIGTTNFMADTGGVFISSNWGDDWYKVLDEEITSIDINSQDEIFALTYWDGVNKSSDLGQKWTNYYFGVKDLTSIIINADGIIYIGCEKNMDPNGGVYVSYNNGVNWDELNDGLTNEYINELYIDNNGFLYAVHKQTIPEGKLFRSINTTINIKDQYETTPASIFIYPNPFKRKIFVNISTKKQSYIEVVILNSIGQIIKKSNSFAINNKSNLEFNFSNYSNGIYFVVAKIDGVIKVSEKIIKAY